jgi:hypothetical protein
MKTTPRVLLVALVLAFTVRAEPPPPLSSKEAARELTILKQAFLSLHPGLLRRRTLAEVDAAFAAAGEQLAQGADRATLFLVVSRLAALVQCGHTWTNPLNQGDAVKALLEQGDKLPVRVRVVSGRLVATESVEPLIPAPTEILAIDGRPVVDLLHELVAYISADGPTDDKRLSRLDSGPNGGGFDRWFPLLHPPVGGVYRVRLSDREVTVRAMTLAAREARLEPADETWRLSIQGGVATLVLPTFTFWKSSFDWRGFLEQAFATLREQKVSALIIDAHANEGGDDAVGRAVLSHLIRRPYALPTGRVFSAYERAPWALARFLDTWDFRFFDRTGDVKREGTRWIVTSRDRPHQVVSPVARPFLGQVVALVGPQMSSAGYLFARDLQASRAATLVGQRTGGSLRGLNGGQLAWLVLPHSGVAVDVPLIGFETEPAQPDRGVEPDVLVTPTVEDVLAGRAVEQLAALKWLASRGQASSP